MPKKKKSMTINYQKLITISERKKGREGKRGRKGKDKRKREREEGREGEKGRETPHLRWRPGSGLLTGAAPCEAASCWMRSPTHAPSDCRTFLLAVLRQLRCWNPAKNTGVSEADGQRPARPPQRGLVQGSSRSPPRKIVPHARVQQ